MIKILLVEENSKILKFSRLKIDVFSKDKIIWLIPEVVRIESK